MSISTSDIASILAIVATNSSGLLIGWVLTDCVRGTPNPFSHIVVPVLAWCVISFALMALAVACLGRER